MTTPPQVSIVVPVYNVEMYVGDFIENIILQTYTNYELIVINDGSTDSSLDVLKSKVKNNPSIKIISKDNGGVSSARNYGLQKCNGDYVIFLDPDDFVHPQMIEILVSNAQKSNADISVCGFEDIINGSEISDSLDVYYKDQDIDYKVINRDFYLKALVEDDNVRGYVWNKMIKTAILKEKDNVTLFDESISFCEDLLFSVKAGMKVHKIVITNLPLYKYVRHTSSVTSSKISHKKLSALDALTMCIYEIETTSIKRLYIEYYYRMNLNLLWNALLNPQIVNHKYLITKLDKFQIHKNRSPYILLFSYLAKYNINLFDKTWKLKERIKGVKF